MWQARHKVWSHPGTEHWKTLGRLIGYLKAKNTKDIIFRNPRVLKAVMFCDFNYVTNKETRKSVSGKIYKIGVTLLTCSLKIYRTITSIIAESD